VSGACVFLLVPVSFGVWAFASLNMNVTLSFLHVCLYVCVSEQESERVMHACHPLHASLCTIELHMTSI